MLRSEWNQPFSLEIAEISAVFSFLTVQNYTAGPSDPTCIPMHAINRRTEP